MYGNPAQYPPMRTVIETPTFQRQAERFWSDDERLTFISWIAANPLVGDVIPGADGARKVRWALRGTGKRGGARIIYFNLAEDGTVLLVMMYIKAERSDAKRVDIGRAT